MAIRCWHPYGQMKQGKAARETQVEVLKAAEIRHRMGLSQGEFAKRWT
ncbi:hypothetical protein ACQKFL_11025 [Vreelandella titanicae]